MIKLKYIIIVLSALIVFNACNDDYDEEYEEYLKQVEEYQAKQYAQYQVDSILITDYLTENDSVAEYHEESGIYYHILNEGDEYQPNTHSRIEVKYKGMLLDGTVFDRTEQDETTILYLNNVITGWQIGVPLIGRDGKIILYLPSFYAYGDAEIEGIPANSVLIFEVDLISFY